MNADDSPELFNRIVAKKEASVAEEFERRNLLSSTIRDLSEQFEEKENVTHAPSEPVLYAKLYALSQIQQSRLGVAGFSPMAPVEVGLIRSVWNAKLQAAPAHDEYTDEVLDRTYYTRAIKFASNQLDQSEVDVIGLNFYQKDYIFDEEDDSKKLVVVKGMDRQGRSIISDDKPGTINGETLVFAVRNKTTNDAKLYVMDILGPNEASEISFTHQSGIKYEDDNTAYVSLPDNQVMKIEQLAGVEQIEAVKELEKATEVLKAKDGPASNVSPEHSAIAGGILLSRHTSI